MAACREQADYGKQRLWGAVGWGICAALAGAIIHRAGLWAAFVGHAVLAVAAFWPTLRLPMGPLHAKLSERTDHAHAEHGGAQQQQQPTAAAAGNAEEMAGGGAGAWGAVHRDDSALEAQALLHQHHKGGRPAGGASNGGAPVARPGCAEGAAARPLGQQQAQVHFWSGLRQLLGNPEAAIFLAQALFFGFGVRRRGCCGRCGCQVCVRPGACKTSAATCAASLALQVGNIEGFLFLYLDQLGASEFLMGISLSVTCAAETAVVRARSGREGWDGRASSCRPHPTTHCCLAHLGRPPLMGDPSAPPHSTPSLPSVLLHAPDPACLWPPALHAPRVPRLPAAHGLVRGPGARALPLAGPPRRGQAPACALLRRAVGLSAGSLRRSPVHAHPVC